MVPDPKLSHWHGSGDPGGHGRGRGGLWCGRPPCILGAVPRLRSHGKEEDRLVPVSVAFRSVCTFCLEWKPAAEPVVDTIACASLGFMPHDAEIPRVPCDSGETQRDPVASDNYDCQLSLQRLQDRTPFHISYGKVLETY